MKALEKARSELEKAIKRRDLVKKKYEDAEYQVKECMAAVEEAENNVYINDIRECGLTVEQLKELMVALKERSLADVLNQSKEVNRDNEEFFHTEGY